MRTGAGLITAEHPLQPASLILSPWYKNPGSPTRT